MGSRPSSSKSARNATIPTTPTSPTSPTSPTTNVENGTLKVVPSKKRPPFLRSNDFDDGGDIDGMIPVLEPPTAPPIVAHAHPEIAKVIYRSIPFSFPLERSMLL
jgi:hypothetical protein